MIDSLMFGQVYDRKANNCLHFAAKAWKLITGDDRLFEASETNIAGLKGLMKQYQKVEGPTKEPAIAVMNCLESGGTHIGICKDFKLLHLSGRGAEFMLFDCYRGLYSDIRFYKL